MLDVWASIDELSEWKRALSLIPLRSLDGRGDLLDADRGSCLQLTPRCSNKIGQSKLLRKQSWYGRI